jgi:hypothetical protein
VAQLAQPLLLIQGKELWPLSPYAMFAYTPTSPHSVVEVQLVEADGSTQMVLPGHVLPIEFFRANYIFRTWFLEPQFPGSRVRSEAEREALAHVVLAGLNGEPWSGFDEIYEPAQAKCGSFVALRVCEATWDVERAVAEQSFGPLARDCARAYGRGSTPRETGDLLLPPVQVP